MTIRHKCIFALVDVRYSTPHNYCFVFGEGVFQAFMASITSRLIEKVWRIQALRLLTCLLVFHRTPNAYDDFKKETSHLLKKVRRNYASRVTCGKCVHSQNQTQKSKPSHANTAWFWLKDTPRALDPFFSYHQHKKSDTSKNKVRLSLW